MTGRQRSLLLAACAMLPMRIAPAQSARAEASSFRTLASFSLPLQTDPHVSPDGHFVLLGTPSDLQVYNVTTKRTTKLADGGAWGLAWAKQGDRIAWVRTGDDAKKSYVWTMALDPVSAAPRGSPQRVTVSQGEAPAISDDGKFLAYSSPESDLPGAQGGSSPHRLVVVPINGGPERVIAKSDRGMESLFWSADGQSVFFWGSAAGGPRAVVTRAFLDGRAPRVVRAGDAEWFAGMTRDRRHLVLVPSKNPIAMGDRALVIDTAGRELGGAQLPVGTINEYDGVIGDTTLVWVATRDQRRLEIRSLAGDKITRVPSVGESNDAPLWSPDGKHITFQVREGDHTWLALMNADGSGMQVFRDVDMRNDQWGAHWSPDSHLIAYTSRDWHRLHVLDVAKRTSTTALADSSARIGNWIWRDDSKAITAVMLNANANIGTTIDELSLTGARRRLARLPLSQPGSTGFQFLDATTAFTRSDSAAYLVPLAGGALRRVADVPAKTRVGPIAVSADRRWIGGPMSNAASPGSQQVEILSTETGRRTVLDTPYRPAVYSQPMFTRDNRSLLMVGTRADEDQSAKLIAVPLNGDTPRVIATVGVPSSGTAFSLAPDGSAVVYSVQDARVTSLLLVDLKPVIANAPASSPRR